VSNTVYVTTLQNLRETQLNNLMELYKKSINVQYIDNKERKTVVNPNLFSTKL